MKLKRCVNGVMEVSPGPEMVELPRANGVFETILLREGAPVFFEDHWARFVRGCHWYGLALPATPAAVQALAITLAAENGVKTGVLRFATWVGQGGTEWRLEVTPPRLHMARGVARLGLGPSLPSADPERPFKHLRRELWLQAVRTARASGWDDAVLLDPAGQVVETGVSNLFFVNHGCLCTPGLETGPLPGIMRGRVLALAEERGMTAKEGHHTLADLQQASEIWVSNSLLGLRPVTDLSGQGFGPSFPVLQQFRTIWREHYGWDPVVIAPVG